MSLRKVTLVTNQKNTFVIKDIDLLEQMGYNAVSYTHLTLPTNREV